MSDTLVRAQRIRLRPTPEQAEIMRQGFGVARQIWNWAKEIIDQEYDDAWDAYKRGEKIKRLNIQYELKKYYRNNAKPDYAYKIGTFDDMVFVDLHNAVRKFWQIQKGELPPPQGMTLHEANGKRFRKDGKKCGWPKWRNRYKNNSFRTSGNNISVEDDHIFYCRKSGWIRMCQPLRPEFQDGLIRQATFSFDGKWYWVSIVVMIDNPGYNNAEMVDPDTGENVTGLDLGLRYLAYSSEGDFWVNLKSWYRYQQKLRRLDRKFDRQKRANNPHCFDKEGRWIEGQKLTNYSKRMQATLTERKRVHQRITNIRRNQQHHISKFLAQHSGAIMLEDLNIRGMMKNKHLSRAIGAAGMYEIRRQIVYKAEYYGAFVGIVDQWFPSSKLCSGCREYTEVDLNLSVRKWQCPNCGQVNDRDLNAAVNLKIKGIQEFINPDFEPPASMLVEAPALAPAD